MYINQVLGTQPIYPFPSSLGLKLQTKILFLILPALVRALFGQRSARAANGQFYILSAPRTVHHGHTARFELPAIFHCSYELALGHHLGHHLTLVAVYDTAQLLIFFF